MTQKWEKILLENWVNFSYLMGMNPKRIIVDPHLIDLVPSYLLKRKNELKNVEKAVQNKDFVSIKTMGHQIRGNAALFGLPWLGDMGALLEKEAEASNGEKVIDVAKEMLFSLEQIPLDAFQPDCQENN